MAFEIYRFADGDCKKFIYVLEDIMSDGYVKTAEFWWHRSHSMYYIKVFSRTPVGFIIMKVRALDAPDCGYSGFLATNDPAFVLEKFGGMMEEFEKVNGFVDMTLTEWGEND